MLLSRSSTAVPTSVSRRWAASNVNKPKRTFHLVNYSIFSSGCCICPGWSRFECLGTRMLQRYELVSPSSLVFNILWFQTSTSVPVILVLMEHVRTMCWDLNVHVRAAIVEICATMVYVTELWFWLSCANISCSHQQLRQRPVSEWSRVYTWRSIWMHLCVWIHRRQLWNTWVLCLFIILLYCCAFESRWFNLPLARNPVTQPP